MTGDCKSREQSAKPALSECPEKMAIKTVSVYAFQRRQHHKQRQKQLQLLKVQRLLILAAFLQNHQLHNQVILLFFDMQKAESIAANYFTLRNLSASTQSHA